MTLNLWIMMTMSYCHIHMSISIRKSECMTHPRINHCGDGISRYTFSMTIEWYVKISAYVGQAIALNQPFLGTSKSRHNSPFQCINRRIVGNFTLLFAIEHTPLPPKRKSEICKSFHLVFFSFTLTLINYDSIFNYILTHFELKCVNYLHLL